MADSKIYEIDFTVPIQDFHKRFTDYLNNFGNSNMSVNYSEQGTRNGKYMYKFEVICSDDNNHTTILFEKDSSTGDVICTPTGFSSFGGTFYKQEDCTDHLDVSDNTLYATISFLFNEAKLSNGLFAAESAGSTFVINNGQVQNTVKSCLVDSKGKVYGAKEVSSVDTEAIDGGVHYNTHIGPWVKEKRNEDPKFDQLLSDKSVTMIDKMYIVGKYLVTLRTKEELEAKEFIELFTQAGALDKFVKEQTLSMLYKLFI